MKTTQGLAVLRLLRPCAFGVELAASEPSSPNYFSKLVAGFARAKNSVGGKGSLFESPLGPMPSFLHGVFHFVPTQPR